MEGPMSGSVAGGRATERRRPPCRAEETAGTHVIDAHQTNLTLPSAQEGRLDLHVDNCRRRCVTISDSQRILQFMH
jgi:hypothetical protein